MQKPDQRPNNSKAKVTKDLMICNFSADHPILYSTGRTLVTNLGNSQSENLRKYDRFLNIVIQRGATATERSRPDKVDVEAFGSMF